MARDILIVDDETDIRMLISGILKDEGFETREAANSTLALQAIRTRQPTLVILDIWLQGSELDGIEVLKIIRRELPALPVIMISGHGTIETAVTAIKIGAYDFIEKPFKSDRLLLIVERAIEAARLRRENQELRLRAGSDTDLVGASAAANHLRQQIEKVAPTGSRVLITGPARAGKEVMARLLHARSRRSGGPFVALNCATMRPDRLEIELFGTAASGEDPRKIGTFEQAHGGTLLLDEVPTCRSRRRARSCGSCRSRPSSASAAAAAWRSMSASSPRRAAISRPKSRRAASARISSTASASCRSACRLCASGARTYRCSPATSWRARPPPPGSAHANSARTRSPPSRPMNGRATSGNCATSSTGCSSWPRASRAIRSAPRCCRPRSAPSPPPSSNGTRAARS